MKVDLSHHWCYLPDSGTSHQYIDGYKVFDMITANNYNQRKALMYFRDLIKDIKDITNNNMFVKSKIRKLLKDLVAYDAEDIPKDCKKCDVQDMCCNYEDIKAFEKKFKTYINEAYKKGYDAGREAKVFDKENLND